MVEEARKSLANYLHGTNSRETECNILIAKHGFSHDQRLREGFFSGLPLWVRERRES